MDLQKRQVYSAESALPLDGFYILFLQAAYRQCHHAVERLHAKVAVVVLLKHGGGIDDVRGKLAVVAVYKTVVVEMLTTAGYGTVLGVGLDTFDEVFDGPRRDFQRIFSVSKYKCQFHTIKFFVFLIQCYE